MLSNVSSNQEWIRQVVIIGSNCSSWDCGTEPGVQVAFLWHSWYLISLVWYLIFDIWHLTPLSIIVDTKLGFVGPSLGCRLPVCSTFWNIPKSYFEGLEAKVRAVGSTKPWTANVKVFRFKDCLWYQGLLMSLTVCQAYVKPMLRYLLSKFLYVLHRIAIAAIVHLVCDNVDFALTMTSGINRRVDQVAVTRNRFEVDIGTPSASRHRKQRDAQGFRLWEFYQLSELFSSWDFCQSSELLSS